MSTPARDFDRNQPAFDREVQTATTNAHRVRHRNGWASRQNFLYCVKCAGFAGAVPAAGGRFAPVLAGTNRTE